MQSPFQLLLDLFDEPTEHPPVKPPVAVPPPPVPDSERSPGEPFDHVLAPQAFRHPDANREARLGDVLVAYEFRRARRQEHRLHGRPRGPGGSRRRAGCRWARWTRRCAPSPAGSSPSGAARERQARIEAARIEWRHGAAFPYLGESVTVVLDPTHDFREAGGVLHTADEGVAEPRRTLRIGLPRHAQPAQIRDAVQAWLMRQARGLFTERLDHYAPQLQVQWRKLTLSSAGTLWGTAHSDGSIRLNWRLVHFRLPVIDYVVAHELSHLRVMDHSPRFWDTVRSVVPNYPELRGQLKDEPLPAW